MTSLDFEREAGCGAIGIDEAGRGPLAGGVFAGAVHLPLAAAERLASGAWREMDDSKKLTPARRERLAATIKATPECVWAVASATPEEIDRLNILNATHLAMRRAAESVLARMPSAAAAAAFALVDGLPVRGLPCPSKSIVKGDSKSLLIAAASILAKTARDADCLRLDKLYPQYGFARHKGYPVKRHLAALAEHGATPEHRRSFAPVAAAIAAKEAAATADAARQET